MPNRILRDWTDSETIDQLDVNAERFFTRLIMKVDDFGRYSANLKLLKSNLYPLKSDIRETDITRWLTACKESGLIVLYNIARKEYLQINNFKQTLRQKTEKYPAPEACVADDTQVLITSIADASLKRNETETRNGNETEGPLAGTVNPYSSVEKTKKGIHEYLKSKPTDIDPYKDFWNLFATEKGLSLIKTISDNRRRKFNVRVREKAFDFSEILRKASLSEFLKTSKWFSFDWIIENDSNYLKVIEGNYDNGKPSQTTTAGDGGPSVNDQLKNAGKNKNDQ